VILFLIATLDRARINSMLPMHEKSESFRSICCLMIFSHPEDRPFKSGTVLIHLNIIPMSEHAPNTINDPVEEDEWSTHDVMVNWGPPPGKKSRPWTGNAWSDKILEPISKDDPNVKKIRWEDTIFTGGNTGRKPEQPYWIDTVLDPSHKRESKIVPELQLCRVCLGRGTQVCSVCKLARYCGPKCQKADWKEHRKSHTIPKH
jgi:hypothetical protein